MGALDEAERPVGHNDHCGIVGQEYLLTTPEGTEIDGDLGITIDKETSKINVATSKQIPKTSLIVTAKIGNQQRVSEPFDIEVYDCNEGMTHAPDIKVQMGSSPYNFDLLKTKPTHPSCGVEIGYKVEGLAEGVTFTTDGEEKGKIKIDTSLVIDTVV